MRTNLAKSYGLGDDRYTLKKVCNLHQTMYGKSNKKKKDGNNNCNPKNDDTNEYGNNKKKDNKADDEGNLVTTHIA